MSRNIKSDINNAQKYSVVAFYARMRYWRCRIIQYKFWNTYVSLAEYLAFALFQTLRIKWEFINIFNIALFQIRIKCGGNLLRMFYRIDISINKSCKMPMTVWNDKWKIIGTLFYCFIYVIGMRNSFDGKKKGILPDILTDLDILKPLE
jgi:hypothetical protein